MENNFLYPGFPFERPIYLYIWEILVILVFLGNVIVILVFMRKSMRNSTNTILFAIAVCDSLTGLVTLPTYIMVYRRYHPAEQIVMYTTMAPLMISEIESVRTCTNASAVSSSDSNGSNVTGSLLANTNVTYNFKCTNQEGYKLSKGLCTGFMLSKFFLSKIFHTISMYLTLFLGFQRYIYIAYPFKANTLFTARNTFIVCGIISVLSTVLHVYHLKNDNTFVGLCGWRLGNCNSGCTFIWIIIIVRHLTPCVLLTLFTVLFIKELRQSRLEMTREQSRRRSMENRRITIIVISIIVVVLVPEIPYSFHMLSVVISKHANVSLNLERNRAIHAAYEILLVLSHHANFYIFIMFYRRFRSEFKATFVFPIRRALGLPVAQLSSSLSSKSELHRERAGFLRKTETLLVNAHRDVTQMSTIERHYAVNTDMKHVEKKLTIQKEKIQSTHDQTNKQFGTIQDINQQR